MDIMRCIKIKFLLLTFVLLIVYMLIFYLFFENWSRRNTVLKSSVVLNYVVVHLDLKGSPPKLEYLESLLPTFVDLGVNGILMEYEDMFPYDRKLVNLSARNCYDKIKLKKFLIKSVRLGVEIIPLVQTFGHMEHALKLQEFKHLREVEKYPDSICPSNPESTNLIRDMLEQVINFHTSIMPLKNIHIGCDEVYSINKCNKCRKKEVTDIHLFFNHLSVVNLIVRDLSPHTKVLIWDDMLRGKRGLQLINLDLSNIEPVSWDYKPTLSVSHADLFNYHKKFENIWIASAFKGADGSTQTIPNYKNRLLNNFFWLHFIMNYKFAGESRVFNFKGIILTGWSRYTHMNPLCELLPASMPSLILNLIFIQTMKKGIDTRDFTDIDSIFVKYLETKFNKYVNCKNMLYVDDLDQTVCSYESSDLYNELKNYIYLHSKINERYSEEGSALSHVNYYYEIKSIDTHLAQHNIVWCNHYLQKLSDLEKKLREYMPFYYEKDVIQEYISDKIYADKKKVWNTLKILKRYSEIRSWERKPFSVT